MAELSRVVDDTVRRERGRIVAALLRFCRSLDQAEDAFQDAALSAMNAWKQALPDNPGAWLMTAAKNSAMDVWRRQAVAAEKGQPPVTREVDPRETIDTVTDDHLRLIFTCCHPILSRESQIALTLKVVVGFSTEEIARAFMTSEDTVSQRILRAKKTLAEANLGFETPARDELGERVGAALGVVYALFNEGHTARSGPLMRLDLQAEALSLGRLLCDLVPGEPEAFGLVAMVSFAAARAETRVDASGLPVLLPDQDRSRWHKPLLREGLMALARARSLGGRGPYVLQAELAALHATAPEWGATDWDTIVGVYDELLAASPSPLVRLNRAIAVSMKSGPAAGLRALEAVNGELDDYHLFHATRADLLERTGADARADWTRALELVANDGERRLLEERLGRTDRSRADSSAADGRALVAARPIR